MTKFTSALVLYSLVSVAIAAPRRQLRRSGGGDYNETLNINNTYSGEHNNTGVIGFNATQWGNITWNDDQKINIVAPGVVGDNHIEDQNAFVAPTFTETGHREGPAFTRKRIEFDPEEGKFEIKSRIAFNGQNATDPAHIAEMRLTAMLRPFPLLRLAVNQDQDDSKRFLRLAVGFLRVVEYNSEHTILQSQRHLDLFGQGNWQTFVTNTTLNSGQTVFSIHSNFHPMQGQAFTNANTTFTLRLHTANPVLNANGTVLDPATFKYDLEINNWPFLYSNSSLAVAKILRTNATIDTLTGSLGVGTGKFGWSNDLTIDGADAPNTVSVDTLQVFNSHPEGVTEDFDEQFERTQLVIFRLGGLAGNGVSRPQKIVWDPEITAATDVIVQTADTPSSQNSTTKNSAPALVGKGLSALAALTLAFLA